MQIFTLDTFTNTPFKGNPAAVCLLQKILSDELMLKIAREINFSETAFYLLDQNQHQINLRWFTPRQEIELCGHATLATAKILYEKGIVAKEKEIEFVSKSGLLLSTYTGNKIVLNFPSKEINACESDQIINAFLNCKPKFVGVDEEWCLIEVGNEVDVKKIEPNFDLLRKHQQKIFIVTASSIDPQYDFVLRCFAPAVGINEDPATGSAFCYLSTFWAKKLRKDILKAFQLSERTAEIECELIKCGRMLIKGECVFMTEIKQDWG